MGKDQMQSIDRNTTEPRREYSSRIDARLAQAAKHMERFRLVGIVRLIFLAIFFLFIWLAFKGLAVWLPALPLIGFFALAPLQQRITESRRRCERAADLYRKGIARLDDRWAGLGSTGEHLVKLDHPYAEDLDLFGSGSLFELLSSARTRVGEETLAHWLQHPAAPDIVRERQAAVIELRSRLDLREDLALLGEGIHTGADAETLTRWAAAPPWHIPNTIVWTARALATLSLISLILWFAGFGWIPLLILLVLGQVFSHRIREPVIRVVSTVETPGKDLQLLSEVLRRLESEQFTAPRLVQLRAQLDVAGSPPSAQIARLKRLIELYDSRRNIVFAPIAALLLWPVQCAIAIERWRQASGPAVARWLAAVGELEALSSIAGYSYEHPVDPFPELVDDAVCFDGEGLGHPLLREAQNVRTDLRLSQSPSVLIVSGSNMSGKSTLLRTVGTNTVLALAGAPVRARRLRLAPLQVGASIRVQDSLQAGASRFYAEITRLRMIVELTNGALPVLFLLDEILHGTNSHDRRIGAEGVVSGLIERGAIGLVTTHDLALTHIVEQLDSRAANVHFEDHLEGGKLTFDYLLRPGILQKSNALELMRSVGLDV
jgi:hypothetical protein